MGDEAAYDDTLLAGDEAVEQFENVALSAGNMKILLGILFCVALLIILGKHMSHHTLWLTGPSPTLFIPVFLQKFMSRNRGTTILLVGPVSAGKTIMFLKLCQSSTCNGTVASMQPNTGTCVPSSETGAKPICITDIPGHARSRGKYFDSYVPTAAGIIFVVDSVDFMPRKTEIAEQLVEILTHPTVAKRKCPVLLACNKADAGPKAHTVDFIRKQLEREIDALRETRGALQETSGGAALEQLGVQGEPFSFGAHARGKGSLVTTTATSAIDAGGLADVMQFSRQCLK